MDLHNRFNLLSGFWIQQSFLKSILMSCHDNTQDLSGDSRVEQENISCQDVGRIRVWQGGSKSGSLSSSSEHHLLHQCIYIHAELSSCKHVALLMDFLTLLWDFSHTDTTYSSYWSCAIFTRPFIPPLSSRASPFPNTLHSLCHAAISS